MAVWISAPLMLSACSNDIRLPFLIPVPVSPAQPAPPPPPRPRAEAATPARGGAEVVRRFTAAGYQRFQAEALADHARIESGFNPCIRGPGGLSYTFQWGWARLQRLHEFAGTRGCPPLDKQLAFADKELRSEPTFACFWRATTRSSALAALRRGFGMGRC
jgi:hypothetical protein